MRYIRKPSRMSRSRNRISEAKLPLLRTNTSNPKDRLWLVAMELTNDIMDDLLDTAKTSKISDVSGFTDDMNVAQAKRHLADILKDKLDYINDIDGLDVDPTTIDEMVTTVVKNRFPQIAGICKTRGFPIKESRIARTRRGRRIFESKADIGNYDLDEIKAAESLMDFLSSTLLDRQAAKLAEDAGKAIQELRLYIRRLEAKS